MDEMLDALIVGAGPIGLETAWAIGRAGGRAAVVDRGAIGSTMRWWAPGTKFFSSPERIAIAGVPMAVRDQEKATREDYLGYLVQVAQTHELDVRTFTDVTDVQRVGDGFEVSVRGARTGADLPGLRARSVVLAIGNMHRPRLLGIPGEDLPHVSHYLRDPLEYVGRRVMIVGGKNSAVEAAIRLYRAGAQVTVSYRREAFDAKRVKYWLRPELEWLISKQKIGFVACSRPVAITPRGVELECVTPDRSATRDAEIGGGAVMHDRQQERGLGTHDQTAGEESPWPAPLANGERRVIEADDVLLLTGYEQDTTLFERIGVEVEGEARKPSFCLRTMETNVPGVFVAGTAVAGTELHGVRVFIENAHVHAERIASSVMGVGPAEAIEGEWFGEAEES